MSADVITLSLIMRRGGGFREHIHIELHCRRAADITRKNAAAAAVVEFIEYNDILNTVYRPPTSDRDPGKKARRGRRLLNLKQRSTRNTWRRETCKPNNAVPVPAENE